jgi:enediyne biosynthesis protein E4
LQKSDPSVYCAFLRLFKQTTMNKIIILVFISFILACKSNKKDKSNLLFEQMEAESTGVDFANNLNETDSWNIIQYPNFYNGGGVAVGDINGDKLPDIYFTSNQGANKLYLNRGDFKFEDITDKAGVADAEGWKTGVCMADVNGDGRLDIYVSHVSNYNGLKGRNRLFVNNGDGTFVDKAAYMGLDIVGLCTQAAFFDYDNDGDLDCYILRQSMTPEAPPSTDSTVVTVEKDYRSRAILLKNYGGRFMDESEQAGVKFWGRGLGLAISDFNNDGHPDIYVGNDSDFKDFLFYNNGNSTFTEGLNNSLSHSSLFSKGNDAADFNNDGKIDFFSSDNKPEEETILKTLEGASAYFNDKKGKPYFSFNQYGRNTLQLNRGNLSEKTTKFSEIGQFSDVSTTDWSWSSLFADLDNDGWKDIFITNGIVRRPNDLDFIKYVSNENKQRKGSDLTTIQQMPSGKASNYCYQNNSDLTFKNVGEAWGLNQYGLSNGAAYADFDNDGDLDLVVNNTNEKAFILKNKVEKFSKNKYLKVKLIGKGGNTEGVGAKVLTYRQGIMQMQEQSPVRGFQSSVESVLHFGFVSQGESGEKATLDSVRVIWRDGSTQIFSNLNFNQTIIVSQKNASQKWSYATPYENLNTQNIVFQDITKQVGLNFTHEEQPIQDFEVEKLIPHAIVSESPKLMVDDFNKDGSVDFLVKANGTSLKYFNLKENNFTPLSITAISTEKNWKKVLDSLKLKGYFQVRAKDFNSDGFMDYFVGNRADAKNYGVTPQSYLLQGDAKGTFKDVTPQYFDDKGKTGMVTDAVWVDFNKDSRPDLVVVGEWMPITIYYNKGDYFDKVEIENTSGWWKCITISDVDKDGDMDMLLGNMGLNANWQASPSQPMRLYTKDFDGNGDIEPVISYHRQDLEWVYASKDELTAQIPSMRKRFTDYTPFANSTFEKIFNKEILKEADKKAIEQFASICLLNKGGIEFELKPLPTEVQLSTCEAILADDFDGDGFVDLALGGNFYEMTPSIGRFDASFGSILRGDGKGNFKPVNPNETGFVLRGAVRDIKKIGKYIVVAKNNAAMQVFELKKK